jgi:Spy/CpxP family protein refolding chaperone
MNRKHLKWTVATIGAVAVLAIAGWAQMQSQGGGPGRHRHFMAYITKQLQLTDAQQAQIKSMWQAQKPAIQPLLQQLAAGRKQMLQLTSNGAFDQGQVSTLAQQQAQVIAQLMVQRQKLISQVYSQVLTPDQRTKAEQLRVQHEQRIDKWLQRMGANTAGD